jgi:hypothetical protein
MGLKFETPTKLRYTFDAVSYRRAASGLALVSGPFSYWNEIAVAPRENL